MKTNNNRRKKEMAPFIAAIRLALSVILLGGTGAFAQTLTTLHDFGAQRWAESSSRRGVRPAGPPLRHCHWAPWTETALFTA